MAVTSGVKVSFGFGVLLILMLILGLGAVYTVINDNRVWNDAIDISVMINNKAKEFEYCRLMTRRYEKDFLIEYKFEGLQAAKSHYIKNGLYSQIDTMKDILAQIELLEHKIPGQENFSTKHLSDLLDIYRSGVSACLEQIEDIEAQKPESGEQKKEFSLNDITVQAMRFDADHLEEGSKEMADTANSNANLAVFDAVKNANESLSFIFYLTLGIFIFALLYAWLMMSNIVRSFKILLASAKDDAMGDLFESFQNLLAKIRQGSSEVTLASNSLSTIASREVSLASEQSRITISAHLGAIEIHEKLTKVLEQLRNFVDEVKSTRQKMLDLCGQMQAMSGVIVSLNEGLQKIVKAPEVASNKEIDALVEKQIKETAKLARDFIDMQRSLESENNRTQNLVEALREISLMCAQESTDAKAVADAMYDLRQSMELSSMAAKQSEENVAHLIRVSGELQANADKIKK